MASRIATSVGKRVFAQQAQQYVPKDPYYETYVDPKSGKEKKRKRPLPETLSKAEQKILRKVRRRAHHLDKGFHVCGFRFGYTFIIGLIPVVGDAADFILSYTLVLKPCFNCEIPLTLRERMLFNQALATGIGAIPLVGDVLMATIKPNSRNAILFEEFLLSRAAKTGSSQQSAEQVVDKAKGWKWNRKTGEAMVPVTNASTEAPVRAATTPAPITTASPASPITTPAKSGTTPAAPVTAPPAKKKFWQV